MTGTTSSVKRVLADFLIPILPKIRGETTREDLIEFHRMIYGNAASVASNLGGDWYGNIALTITAEDYMEQTG